LDDVDLLGPLAFVVGNEAWGLPDGHAELLDDIVRIEMPGPAESLNVAVAGSILLFEAARRRRVSSSSL
jgi:TrmH family RNA methyltransferase